LLDRVVAGVDREQQVDGVAQRRIVGVGPVPAAPADVVADAILGDPAQRVVEGAHAQLRPGAVVLVALTLREHRVALVHEHGVVDLEQEPRVRDRLVLLVQGVREPVDECLLVRVVLVLEPVRTRRRDDRQKRLGLIGAVLDQRRLEIGDVALDGRAVVFQRACADPLDRRHRGDLLDGAARVARAGRRLIQRVLAGVGAGEVLTIAARRQHAALMLDVAQLKATDTLVQIGDPRNLANLAIIDHIQANLELLLDDPRNSLPQSLAIHSLIDRLPRSHSVAQRHHLRGPDQATGVRRQNTVHQNSFSLNLIGVEAAGGRRQSSLTVGGPLALLRPRPERGRSRDSQPRL
jgi:hypothetical protein